MQWINQPARELFVGGKIAWRCAAHRGLSLTKSKHGAIGAMAAQSDSSGTAGYSLFAGQPRGLSTLFFTELWERFSYYGMRALLTFFIIAPLTTGGLGLTTVEAARIYGNYTMAVYLLAIP